MSNKKIDKKDSTYVYMESSEKKTKMGQSKYNKNHNSRKLPNVIEKDLKLHFESVHSVSEKTFKIPLRHILGRLLNIKEKII